MSFVRVLLVTALVLGVASPAGARGTRGVSPDGKPGWLHTVEKGDTLWDITAEYLGSPWIWPTVWKENQIENPHRISPGEVIWISEGGIRKVTPEEAAEFAARGQGQEEQPAAPADGAAGSSLSNDIAPETTTDSGQPDMFAALDGTAADRERRLHWPGLHRYGFMTETELNGAAAVLGSHEEGYWTAQERKTIVSLGEGRVHIGDVYTLFRTRRRILHPETGALIGYFVEQLGTAEVTEIHTESSFVKILSSYAEIEPGDRLVPYVEEPKDFQALYTPVNVKGMVLAVQIHRQYAINGDIVVIDRGRQHGVQVGHQFEVFRAGKEVHDPVTTAKTLVPDDIVGQLFVVKTGDSTSLALLTRSTREVKTGDHFRNM
jgi:hypothetical protein